jgi:hypothetical protein
MADKEGKIGYTEVGKRWLLFGERRLIPDTRTLVAWIANLTLRYRQGYCTEI